MRKFLYLLSPLLFFVNVSVVTADQASQRLVPGNSLCLSGLTIDACSPAYSPPAGSYSVAWTGSAGPRPSDDFEILLCGAQNNAAVTYTMPQSTSSVFPTGHQVIFKNDSTSQTAPGICTITATVSTICAASSVVGGLPSAPCGPITLFPGGEVTLIATAAGNYLAVGYVPGSWYQFGNSGSGSLVWVFPAYSSGGYTSYTLNCQGLIPSAASGNLFMQVAYNGTFQTTGYSFAGNYGSFDSTSGGFGATGQGGIKLSGLMNNGGPTNIDGGLIRYRISQAVGTGSFYAVRVFGQAAFNLPGGEQINNVEGIGPSTTASNLTGIQIYFDSGNIRTGMCWLQPGF